MLQERTGGPTAQARHQELFTTLMCKLFKPVTDSLPDHGRDMEASFGFDLIPGYTRKMYHMGRNPLFV